MISDHCDARAPSRVFVEREYLFIDRVDLTKNRTGVNNLSVLDRESMVAKSAGSKESKLVRSAVEKYLSKKEEEEQQRKRIPYLHGDFISNILLRLPIESLISSRFVCKPWYNIVNDPLFVEAHLNRSESVLIFQVIEPTTRRLHSSSAASSPLHDRNTFSVEERLLRADCPVSPVPPSWKRSAQGPRFFFRFMEFKQEKNDIREYKICTEGSILAACNGLILLENKLKKGGLLVMNPVTRKLSALPVGTLSSDRPQSYGFAFDASSNEYKVVHLFVDNLQYTNCEILNLGTRTWKGVDGPSSGLIRMFQRPPVSTAEALHWVPDIHPCGYIVSLGMEDETFFTTFLPNRCRAHDSLIEMDGSLCFISHDSLDIAIWILNSLKAGSWTCNHRITKGVILDMVPLLSLRISGGLIFRRKEDGSFYVYDFELDEMRLFETGTGSTSIHQAFAHVNSLVTWTRS